MKYLNMNLQGKGHGNDDDQTVKWFSRIVSAWLLGTVLSIYPATTLALDLYWVCGDGFEWDSSPATYCWSTTPGGAATVGAPASLDNVNLTQSGATDITVEYYDPAPAASLASLVIDATGAGTMTLSQVSYSHDLFTDYELVGDSGTGGVQLSNGTHTVTFGLTLGVNATGNGSYNLGGTGSLTADFETIGFDGTGSFIQTGGTHAVTGSDLVLGFNATGKGTYDLSGSGSLTAISEFIGASGTGDFTQSDGTHTVSDSLYLGYNATGKGSYDLSGGIHTVSSNLYLGYSGGGSGTYTLSGTGNLNTFLAHIGYYGDGAFIQNGGTHTVDTLTVGDFSGATGSYDLSAGDLTADFEILGSGSGSAGTFTQSGGTHTVTSQLSLASTGGSTGTFVLSGTGSLVSAYEIIGTSGDGLFTQSGGTHTVINDLYLGYLSGGSGTYNQSGGTHTVSNNLYLGLNSGSTGTYTLNGGALTVDGNIIYGAGTSAFNFNAGTLNLGGDLTTSNLGTAMTLTGLKTLNVAGTTTLDGFSTLALDGGTFSTGYLVDNGGFAFNSGTFNLTGDNLTIGSGGLFGSRVLFDLDQVVNVSNTVNIDPGAVLSMRGGLVNANLTNNSGTIDMADTLSELGGVALDNNGLIHGTGTVSATFTNNAGGEVRADAGDTLTFTASNNSNAGEINLTGGTVAFTQDVLNLGTGFISGRGVLVADGGLTNQGNIALSSGTTDIYGDVNNASGGAITVSGNGTATFYDDVVHNGSEIRVSNGSNAVFFGSVSGSGPYTGTGSVFFEGDLRPGSSPGLVSVGGDMSLGLNSHTIMEIAGRERGTQYDAFDIGGDLFLGGELEVSLYDAGSGLFTPQPGDSFDLFAAPTISGDFDTLYLAALGGGLGWQVDVLADAIGLTDVVRLSVVASAVPVPPSVWLFGSGLLGLIGIARRRQAA
jgi:hypothetical protein